MNLKLTLLSVLTAATVAAPAHALVAVVADCSTSDGQYSVSIMDNQGIGLQRTSNMVATVSDSSGSVVASYKVEANHGPASVSFGRPTYQDSASSGAGFLLQGPSTNEKNSVLSVKLNLDGKTGTIKDNNLNCVTFNGIG